MNLYDILQSTPQETALQAPVVFRLPAQQPELEALFRSGAVTAVHDTLADQLRDLIDARMPSESAEVRDKALQERIGDERMEHHGAWVFYPWSGRLVHVLPAEEYRELRADRNQYLILPEERRRLEGCRVGIIGLSVGQAIATCMAMEGVGGQFVLADLDHLDFSNLNRVYGGVHEVGLPKTTMAARHMWEIDPWLQIETHPTGLTSATMDAFFEGLDLVIEECDNVVIKLRAREEARRRGIPLLMATSDRGMLDLERFDREPTRPIFHGILGDTSADDMERVPPPERLVYLEAMANMGQASSRTIASLLEMRQSISTWPQLASAVVLGAGAITHLARGVLLEDQEQTVPSGRFFLDLDELITADNAATITPFSTPVPAKRPLVTPIPIGAVDPHEPPQALIRSLVEHGITAPSAGNTQPWRFRWSKGALHLHHHPEENANPLDPNGRADRMALGAAVENIAIAATAVGWESDVERVDHTSWRMSFRQTGVEPDPLREQLDRRCCHRYIGPREALPPELLVALQHAARVRGGFAHFRSDPQDLDRISEVQEEAARIGMFGPVLHAKMIDEFRWTPQEALATRTGQDLAAADVPEPSKVILRMLRNRGAIDVLKDLDKGAGLGLMTRMWMDGAAAAMVLRAPTAIWDDIGAGRVVQRVWLEATAQGWALQPLGWASFMFQRIRERDPALQFGRASLLELERTWTELWPSEPGQRDIFFFRIVRFREETRRSLRRGVDEVLSFDG